MRIFAVNNLFANSPASHRKNYTVSPDYCPCSYVPVLSQRSYDSYSFTGKKIPSLVMPTAEDLINKTKAVNVLRFNILRLARNQIPCPCCGHVMLDPEKYKLFEKKVMNTTKPHLLLKYADELREYLHPVEADVFSIMNRELKNNPEISLHGIIKSKLKNSEKHLIARQSKIFEDLTMISGSLPPEIGSEVKNLINEGYKRLYNMQETSSFSRKVFIGKLEKILDAVNDKSLKKNFVQRAAALPAAYNNVDAFIVKYAKKNYKDSNPDQKIVLRLVGSSLATLEHIKPQKLHGADEPGNLALECACDNSIRHHDSIVEQVLKNPSMVQNYKKYMLRLCELHLQGILEKSYITQTNKAYCTESKGLLDFDLSILNRGWRALKSVMTETDSPKIPKNREKL